MYFLLKVAVTMNSEYDNSQFYNTICSNFFTLLVLQPTRVTDKSKTLIGNNFLNNFELTTLPGNIMYSSSDHLIELVVLEDFIPLKSPPKSNTYKKFFYLFDSNKIEICIFELV